MTDQMLAGVFVKEGELEIQARPIPQLESADDVLIEIEGCGLCGTDLHILSTPPGIEATPGVTLGHEFLGEVVDVGSNVQEFSIGDRVVVDPNLKCGSCRYCRMGLVNHCENWTTLGIHIDGGFTSYAVAPGRALHPISQEVPFEDAVWTELLSCVTASADRIAIQSGQTAVVIGAGPAGLLHGMLFKAAGARVIISDIAPMRIQMAGKAGLDVTVNVESESLAEVVADLTDGLGAGVVVDAVGSQFHTCLEVVAKRGIVALFGMDERAYPPIQQASITRDEITVFGSFVGYYAFPRAIQILERGVIKPSILISHMLPVDQMLKGVEAARRREAIKVVVQPVR